MASPSPSPSPSPSSPRDRRKMELDAAQALAALAGLAAAGSHNSGSRSRKRCKSESPVRAGAQESSTLGGDTCSTAGSDGGHTATGNRVQDRPRIEQCSELIESSIKFRRRSKQNLSAAEKEERRLRRVLANRESARQTIRRRQAIREELTRKVAYLSLENENMKMEMDLAMKEYLSLKDTNELLKEQIAKTVRFDAERSAHTATTEVESPTCSLTRPQFIMHKPSISADTKPFL